MNTDHTNVDWAAVRRRLAEKTGPRWWRSLREIADGGPDAAADEFPPGASEWDSGVARRTFFKLMGASLGLAGMAGCESRPPEKIMPYVRAPQDITLGLPLYYATAFPLAGYGLGVLGKCREGRPIKIEGNPQHPSSDGATDAFAQASIRDLYDPDRSQVTLYRGDVRPFNDLVLEIRGMLAATKADRGAGLRILTGVVTSPTMAAQLAAFLKEYPAAKWHQWQPAVSGHETAGLRAAFGEDVHAVRRFEDAEVVLSLDADFLSFVPGRVRHAKGFARQRRVLREKPTQNRLYVVESSPSLTGAKADHRLPIRASDVAGFARAVLAGVSGTGPGRLPESAVPAGWTAAVVADLLARRGRSLVVAGDGQPPEVHAIAAAINERLGNTGKTVIYTEPVEARPYPGVSSLAELTADMKAGRVQMLLVLECDPVYSAPADLDFPAAFARVPLSVHLGTYVDATARAGTWHVPATHYLEAWSDIRSDTGLVTIQQPLIAPLYVGTRSPIELLALLSDSFNRSGFDLLRDHWRAARPGDDFDARWARWLHDGFIPDSEAAPKTVALREGFAAAAPAAPAEGLEIVFRPDPSVYDGRFANNGWMQELPKPFTKITWDNVAAFSPADAERLGLANEMVVELRLRGRTVRAPVWVVPGQAPGSVTVTLGYGHEHIGRLGIGQGFHAGRIRTADAPFVALGLEVAPTDADRYPIACTQEHQRLYGREIVHVGTVQEFRRNPDSFRRPLVNLTLYNTYRYDGYMWGMVIDQTTCIGCNACTVACQAENNIPIVGKEEVIRGREMHWLRVDNYFLGDAANPRTAFQPMLCVHCEEAPCEVVCPVMATVHDAEGINNMVYNRCVGTRYCSNNCPWKVRRFNFFNYGETFFGGDRRKAMANPEVTVRIRGVMEKCTYCVQRISQARIEAKKQDRRIREGEVLTACQAVCPADAIVFGDLNNPDSKVLHFQRQPHDYPVLGELGTRPRTHWLALITNPNPALREA